MRIHSLLASLACLCLLACGEPVPAVFEVGPYTVTTLEKGVLYGIEDSNQANPAGIHFDAEGKIAMNNCSNMYVVLGRKQTLLIDLSNNITWHEDAAASLRQIFDQLGGKREKLIAITHVHFDHTGMAHAFVEDPEVRFFLPKADFEGSVLFPEDRSTLIEDGYVFDLGGIKVDAVDVKGHTPGSMVYSVEGHNAIFSGDAVGSGGGVWIFSLDGYLQFEEGLAHLLAFVNDPANGIDAKALTIYGGHDWQKLDLPRLDMQYLLDMQACVDEIAAGKAVHEPYNNPRLNTNFKHGIATITWNKEDYQALCAQRGVTPEGF